MSSKISTEEALKKLEYFCSYQERCHFEVEQKLQSFDLYFSDCQKIIVSLIDNNYLNEERFTSLFTISKLHQKKWGRLRIKNELKSRKISDYLINKSLKEINSEEYNIIFETLSQNQWNSILEKNSLKKRKKFCDYLLRKGWESDLIYEKMKDLESKNF